METERTVVNPACAEGCLQWSENRSCARVRPESLTYLTQRHGNGTSCCEPGMRRRMFTVERKSPLRSCQAEKPDVRHYKLGWNPCYNPIVLAGNSLCQSTTGPASNRATST